MLQPGVELLGEYQGSGLRTPPYLVRRPDGHVAQITRLLHEIAVRSDGRRDAAAIAAEVGDELNRHVTASDVATLIERRLVPAGIVATDDLDPATPAAASEAPFALRVRAAVVPAAIVRALSATFRPMFAPVLVGAVLAWLVALDAWLVLRHGLDAAIRDALGVPGVLLLVYGLAVLGTVFHEIGHAAACRYGGARPGRMGIGLYYVWPVFYTDVTDAYRLDRKGRLRTDLGGVYFNGIYALLLAAAYFRTGFEPLLIVVLIQHVQAAQQLVPWLRLDGYYVLTDLVGVPDVLARARQILASLVPGREPDPRVHELKPWVRVVVSVYLLVTVPAFVVLYALLLVRAPTFFEATAKALRFELGVAEAGWRAHDVTVTALGAANVLALALPAVGIAFVLANTVARLVRVVLARLARRPAFRTSASFAAGIAVAALFFAGLTAARVVQDTTSEAPAANLPHVEPARAAPAKPRAQRKAKPPPPPQTIRRATNFATPPTRERLATTAATSAATTTEERTTTTVATVEETVPVLEPIDPPTTTTDTTPTTPPPTTTEEVQP